MPSTVDASFYHSTVWKKTRAAFVKARRGLCEDCLSAGIIKAGKIVHHKTPITADNINDPSITLSFDNLKLVCQDCHAKEHGTNTRYMWDADGNPIQFK